MLEVVNARREFGEHVGTALSAVNQFTWVRKLLSSLRIVKRILTAPTMDVGISFGGLKFFPDDCRIPFSSFVVIVKTAN